MCALAASQSESGAAFASASASAAAQSAAASASASASARAAGQIGAASASAPAAGQSAASASLCALAANQGANDLLSSGPAADDFILHSLDRQEQDINFDVDVGGGEQCAFCVCFISPSAVFVFSGQYLMLAVHFLLTRR